LAALEQPHLVAHAVSLVRLEAGRAQGLLRPDGRLAKAAKFNWRMRSSSNVSFFRAFSNWRSL